MSRGLTKVRQRWAIVLLAPVLALGGITLISSPTQAVPCAAVGSPQIHASATVQQGAAFRLRGRGLAPCAEVDVYIGGRNSQYLGYDYTNPSGEFDSRFGVPANLPLGTQVITVQDGSGAVYTTTIQVVRGEQGPMPV